MHDVELLSRRHLDATAGVGLGPPEQVAAITADCASAYDTQPALLAVPLTRLVGRHPCRRVAEAAARIRTAEPGGDRSVGHTRRGRPPRCGWPIRRRGGHVHGRRSRHRTGQHKDDLRALAGNRRAQAVTGGAEASADERRKLPPQHQHTRTALPMGLRDVGSGQCHDAPFWMMTWNEQIRVYGATS